MGPTGTLPVGEVMELEGCALPDDLLYDLELEVWARPPGTKGDLWEFGMFAPMASFAGKFLAFHYRPIEGPLQRSQSVATAESLRFTGAIRIPLDGTLVETNPLLPARPKLLNDEPYARGWVGRVRPARNERPPTLQTAQEVRERVLALIAERRIRCYPATPDVEMYEIGSECSAVLAHLDDEVARRAPEEVILLVADDPTAPIELERWRMRTGHSLLHRRKEGNLYHYLVRKERDPKPEPRFPASR